MFGAQVVECGSLTAVCGGVGQHPSSQGQDVAFVSLSEGLQIHLSAPSGNTTDKWPLMVGSSVISLNNHLIILGGGGTCFSMGTFWETGIYSIDTSGVFPSHLNESTCGAINISYVDSPKVTHSSADLAGRTRTAEKVTMTTIPRVRLNSDSDFKEVLRNRKPVIIEGLDLGQCVENWTPKYMVQRLGEKKEVSYSSCRLHLRKANETRWWFMSANWTRRRWTSIPKTSATLRNPLKRSWTRLGMGRGSTCAPSLNRNHQSHRPTSTSIFRH